MNLKQLFSIHYPNDLILKMLKGSKAGYLVSNLIAPAIVSATLYNNVPTYIIMIWYFLHIVMLIARKYFNNKLNDAIENNKDKVSLYLNMYLYVLMFTALLYGVVSWIGVIFNIPDVNIFIIGSVILAITAGSIVTLGTVYIAFVVFLVFQIVPFIFALLYHGGLVFNIYAISLMIYFTTYIIFSNKLFLTYKNFIELENKFKTIYDKSSDGIVIIENNKIIECNETIISMFGYDNNMSEFLSINLKNFIPLKQPDGISSIKKILTVLKIAQKQIITFEWLHIKQNDDTFWVEITLRSIILNNKKVIHGTWRDISRRKKYEEEIKNLNATLESKIINEVEKNRKKDQQIIEQSRLAQMGEMISMIAHQWRQPLAAISSTSNGISLKAKLNKLDKEKAIELADKITTYSAHLSSTIDDFRDFFKVNKEKKDVTYNELINSVLNIIEVSIVNKNIKLVKEFNSEDKIYTYPNEIKQVILNIIQNSEDAILEKKIINPYIKIVTFQKENKFILQIIDNGGGISSDIIDKIFDPYFSTKTKKNGTGLGLYMSKTIIEEHCDGELNINSFDNKTIFEIVLNG